MIALKDNLPLIQLPTGHSVAFDRNWLVRSLARAASKAGYAQWWLAEHVAQSVTEYLRQQREMNIMSIDRLNGAVKAVLEVIGYPEVGLHFISGRPVVQLSLIEIVRAAGSGYELAFFDLLGRQIHEIVCDRGCDFELLDLDRCVKMLKSKKVWSRECEALRNDIISFTRMQAELAAGADEVTFALS